MSAASSRTAGALAETLLWWLISGGVWVVTLTSRTAQELAAAAVCTLPCGAAAGVARRANAGSWRFRPGWLGWMRPLASELMAQTVQVWAYALAPSRRKKSAISPVMLPAEPRSVAAARRAAATLALATTPGTVVLDSTGHSMLVHRIAQHRGALETAVRQ